MVKDIFFDATNGRRSADNYFQGQLVLDSLKYFYYRPYFERIYKEWKDGVKSSRSIMQHIYLELYQRGYFDNKAREVAMAIKKVLLD